MKQNIKPAVPASTSSQGSVSAGELNAIAAELARQGRLHVDGGGWDQNSGGTHLTVPEPDDEFWARIGENAVVGPNVEGDEDCARTAYHWIEQDLNSCGTFSELEGGRSGDTVDNPAFEVNGNSTVSSGTYVRMRPGYQRVVNGTLIQEYLFFFRDCPISGSGSGVDDEGGGGVGGDCCPHEEMDGLNYLAAVSLTWSDAPCDCLNDTYTLSSTADVSDSGCNIGSGGGVADGWQLYPTTQCGGDCNFGFELSCNGGSGLIGGTRPCPDPATGACLFMLAILNAAGNVIEIMAPQEGYTCDPPSFTFIGGLGSFTVTQ